MSFGTPTSVGTKNDGTGASCIITTTAAIPVGNLAVAFCSKDNDSTTDGVTNEVTSATDSTGANTWTKIGEYCKSGGAADAGVVVAAFLSRVTTEIPSGGTVTLNFSSSKNGQVGEVLSTSVGASVSLDGTVQGVAESIANPSALTVSGLANIEHLFMRIRGAESRLAAMNNWTATASYTATTAVLDTVEQIGMKAEWRILTATEDTSDPGAATNSTDSSSIYFALKEATLNTGNFFQLF